MAGMDKIHPYTFSSNSVSKKVVQGCTMIYMALHFCHCYLCKILHGLGTLYQYWLASYRDPAQVLYTIYRRGKIRVLVFSSDSVSKKVVQGCSMIYMHFRLLNFVQDTAWVRYIYYTCICLLAIVTVLSLCPSSIYRREKIMVTCGKWYTLLWVCGWSILIHCIMHVAI